MTIVWIVTSIEPHLLEAFRAAHWEIEVFSPIDFETVSPSRLGQVDALVFEITDSRLLELCREICRKQLAPVLALVSHLAYAEAVLESGVDDFLVLPVDPLEVMLRLRKLVQSANVVRVGELVIDLAAWRVRSGGRRVQLSSVEFRLLACLAKRVGQMVSHATILEEVWGWEAAHETFAQVKNYVGRLRKKIEPDAHHPQYIVSIPGEGYRLRNQQQWEENRPGIRYHTLPK